MGSKGQSRKGKLTSWYNVTYHRLSLDMFLPHQGWCSTMVLRVGYQGSDSSFGLMLRSSQESESLSSLLSMGDKLGECEWCYF